MASPEPTVALEPEVLALHERLQRSLLAQGAHYQPLAAQAGGWRQHPAWLHLGGDPSQDPEARSYVLVPISGRVPLEAQIAFLLPVAQSLPPPLRQRLCFAAVCRQPPPQSTLADLEGRLEIPLLAFSPAGVTASALTLAAWEEPAQALLAVEPGPEAPDPEAAYQQALGFRDELLFFSALQALVPTPWATRAVLGLCGLLWLIQVTVGGVSPTAPQAQDLVTWQGCWGPLAVSEPWRLLTAGFLHIGILHLGLNMWVLRDLGGLCERLFGHLSFLAIYLFAIVGGCLASVGWHPEIPSAGASGGIFGLGGAALGFMLAQQQSVPPKVFLRYRKSVGAFLFYNLAFGFLINETGVIGIDNAAHLGGATAGFVGGYLLARPLRPDDPGLVRRRLLVGLLPLLAVAGFFAVRALPGVQAAAGELQQHQERWDRFERLQERATRLHPHHQVLSEQVLPALEAWRGEPHEAAEAERLLQAFREARAGIEAIELEDERLTRLQGEWLDAIARLLELYGPGADDEAYRAAVERFNEADTQLAPAWEEWLLPPGAEPREADPAGPGAR